jgi:hypothetical protein
MVSVLRLTAGIGPMKRYIEGRLQAARDSGDEGLIAELVRVEKEGGRISGEGMVAIVRSEDLVKLWQQNDAPDRYGGAHHEPCAWCTALRQMCHHDGNPVYGTIASWALSRSACRHPKNCGQPALLPRKSKPPAAEQILAKMVMLASPLSKRGEVSSWPECAVIKCLLFAPLPGHKRT